MTFVAVGALVALGVSLAPIHGCLADPPPANPKPAPPAEEPSPKPGDKPAEPEAPRAAPPPAPGSGLAWVDTLAGKPRLGSSAETILKLLGKRPPELYLQFMYETPVHDVVLNPYFVDECEVTNAQYRLFLDQTAKTTYKTGSSSLANLGEISSYFAYGDPKAAAEKSDKASWRQYYELNREALHAALPELLKAKDGKKLSPEQIKAQFQLAALPPDIELSVYRRRLPSLWFATSGKFESDVGPNHPVRDVSYLDAEAFADWAGKHVLTEPEWEYAARGPKMKVYPWGDDWKEGMDTATGKRTIEDRCNWLDLGIVSERTREPTTVEVDKMPEGRSWCGAYHMLGNVAEWTSSWFAPYEGWSGSSDQAVNKWASYYPDYVKVVRGGSCGDRERLALRLPYRNFIGIERLAPPKPENSFSYTGFRCGYYLTPALDRLQPAISRLLRPKKVRQEEVVGARFGGAAAVRFAPAGSTVENNVHVLGKSSALLVAPLTAVFRDETKKSRVSSASDLLNLEQSEDEVDPPVFAIFHTDLPIDKVKMRDPKVAAPEPGRRRKKKEEKPALIEGVLPPDTYLLGISHGMLAVYRSNLDFVAFLEKPTIKDKDLKKGEEPPRTTADIERDVGKATFTFWVPFGGKGADRETNGATIQFMVLTPGDSMDTAGNWRMTGS